MNRDAVLALAYQAVELATADEPSVRTIAAMFKRITLKGIRTDDVRIWLDEKRRRDTNGTQSPTILETPRDTVSEHKNAVLGYTSGHGPGEIGTPTCVAPADHSRVVIDSAQVVDKTPYLLPSVVDITPSANSIAESVVPTQSTLLAIVADVEPGEKRKPSPRATIASQDANADFGAFEADVAELFAVEAGLRRDGTISTKLVEQFRRKLGYWRRKHGEAAFARGLQVGIESGKGVDYARGAMERYNPENDRMPLRNVVENGVRISAGGIIDSPGDPRPALELIAEARAKGIHVPELVIPPCQIRPGEPGALSMIRCPHCHENRGVA